MSNSTKLNNLQLIVLSVLAVRLVNNGEGTKEGKGKDERRGDVEFLINIFFSFCIELLFLNR